jgi:hypothetical protein
MATVSTPSGDSTLPVAGALKKAAPITGWINSIRNFCNEAANLDEANADLTSSDGLVGKSTAQTITGLKTLENTSVAAGGIRTALEVGINPSSGTPAAADGPSLLFYGDDTGGTKTTLGEIRAPWVTPTDGGTEAANIEILTRIAGSGTEVVSVGTDGFILNESGADLDYRFESDTNTSAFTIDSGLFSGVGGVGVAAAATTAAVLLIDNPALTAAASTNIAKLRVENSAAITVPAGTTSIAAAVSIDEPNLTATGTITSAVTLYVEAAPTEGSTNNYALWVDSGATKLDGALTVDGATTITSLAMTGALTVTSSSANALAVGANGTTNPALKVDASASSVATGISVTGAAAASRAALAVISSGTDEGLSIDAKGAGTVRLGATSTGAVEFSRNAVPTSSDGAALGTSSLMWADLFLASGSVINFNAGDVTITHSSNVLAFAGASTNYTFDALVAPASNDGAALGSTSLMWSDLFLASGSVINFNNGDVTMTHSSDALTISGGSVIVDGTFSAPFRLGALRIWYDSTNEVIRVKNSAPSSITDGRFLTEESFA